MNSTEGNLAKDLATASTSASPQPPSEEVSRRRVRMLLGWMTEQDGISVLLGRPPMLAEDVTAPRMLWQAARNAVQARPAYSPRPVLVDTGDRTQLDAVAHRADVAAHFSGMNWRPEWVDLGEVLSFQKGIVLDGADERIGSADRDASALFKLCIPGEGPAPSPAAISSDPDNKGFTISSLNPNLRIVGAQVSDADVSPAIGMPPMKMKAFTILAFTGLSYLQVVRYRDRCFVRDGYHRATGLLRRGVRVVPCIFIEARNFGEVGCPPGSLTDEVMYGDRPPRLVDFWDDATAREVEQIAIRKVLRVRGDEFLVPR